MKQIFTCIAVCVLVNASLADIWTVDDDGKADFGTIQAAVDASSDGDEIIVSPGTYTSTASAVVDMQGKAVTLKSSDPSDPKVVAATIIDGEGARRGIICTSSETNRTIIEGFTVTNGYSAGGGGGSGGGGMFNLDSSPTLTNCTFSYNNAPYGGGLRNKNSNPELIGCTFTDNTADVTGGGMYNGSSSPTLKSCIFKNNTSETGGGIKNFNGDPILTNCEFTGNSSSEGGGMYNGQSDPTISACTFADNVASLGGGGMYNTGSSNAVLTTCEFDGNSSSAGGAMQNKANGDGVGKTLILGCAFLDNFAESGGAVDNIDSNPTIEGCSFERNLASVGDGGGIRNSGTSFPAIGSTAFCGNLHQDEEVGGHISGSYKDLGGNEFQEYCFCLGDIDVDGIVGVKDLLLLISAWGCDDCVDEDLDGDGFVGVKDLLALINAWGSC